MVKSTIGPANAPELAILRIFATFPMVSREVPNSSASISAVRFLAGRASSIFWPRKLWDTKSAFWRNGASEPEAFSEVYAMRDAFRNVGIRAESSSSNAIRMASA